MAVLIHCFMGISILSSVIGEVALLSVSYSGMIFLYICHTVVFQIIKQAKITYVNTKYSF